MTNYGGPAISSGDEWQFGFAGYMRAPLRIGVGERLNAKTDQATTTLSVPQVPTDSFIDWQYTKTIQREWLEAYFSYGNSWAKGVFSIEQFRFSQSAWADPEAVFGVGQAWVELTPDMSSIDENMRMNAKIGSFSGRYGGAGQYNAGAYDTFIIGRTHQVGEAIRVEYDYNDFIFYFEEGFGARQPNPSPFHNTKFTLLAHGHAGFNWDQFFTLNVHIMHSWTQEPDHDCVSREEEIAAILENTGASTITTDSALDQAVRFAEGPVGACKHETAADDRQVSPTTGSRLATDPTAAGPLVRRSDTPDGSLQVLGADMVFNTSSLGRIFIGGSYLTAEHAVNVAPAIEVLHAFGGGFFKSGVTHLYFNEKSRWDDPEVMARGGNGRIVTAEAQWDVSLSSLIGPEIFGQQQLQAQVFGMFNLVQSDDDEALESVTKLKYGADLLYSPASWFGVGVRGDRVEPRADIPEQSFTAIAPRLVFRSDFGTHEEIQIGYGRYFYNTRECPRTAGRELYCVQAPGATVAPDGWGNRPGVNSTKAFRGAPVDVESTSAGYKPTGAQIQDWDMPMEHVFYISAEMWW